MVDSRLKREWWVTGNWPNANPDKSLLTKPNNERRVEATDERVVPMRGVRPHASRMCRASPSFAICPLERNGEERSSDRIL